MNQITGIRQFQFCLTRRVIKNSFFLISLLAASRGSAEEFSLASFDKLIIVAPQAQLVLLPGTATHVKVAPQLGLGWTAKEEGTTLKLIATTNPGAQKPGPAKIEINTAPIAVEIHVLEGQVQMARWNKPVLIDLMKGKLQVKENRSSVAVTMGQGQVSIQDQMGAVLVEGVKSDININGVQGNVDVSVLNGNVVIEKTNGSVKLQHFQGGAEVKQVAAGLSFRVGKAGLVAAGVRGHLDGLTDEGNVSVQLSSDLDGTIRSNTGRVVLDAKNSGTFLALRSEEGEISGLKNVKPGKDRGAQVLKTRMKGDEGGRFEVNSQKGNIIVKE